MSPACVLIVEDGDEYFENLRAFVSGFSYRQAHNAEEALAQLREGGTSLLYLDMRFDRIPRSELVGDHAALVQEHNGDARRAWRFLADNQGLFILAALQAAGFGQLPTVLAYDFSREQQRWQYLQRTYPRLAWAKDGISADEIRMLIRTMLGG